MKEISVPALLIVVSSVTLSKPLLYVHLVSSEYVCF